MRRNSYIIIGVLLFVLVGMSRCSGSKASANTSIDELIAENTACESFSIMLVDMDVEGTFFKKYLHQYLVIKEQKEIITRSNSGWVEVSEQFYKANKANMGMVMASKGEAGKLNKTPTPPGYSNYVGNSRYGHWRERSNGSSFWEFYGKYAMLSSIFNMTHRPIYRSSYRDYRSNYYGSGRTYYGSNSKGGRYYGSNSGWSNKTSYGNRFKNKVRNRTTRSSGSSRYSTKSRSSTKSRNSRSSSRYSRSSMRSRGGGFGK